MDSAALANLKLELASSGGLDVVIYIGLAALLALSLTFLSWIWHAVKLYAVAQIVGGVDLKRFGSWAVVTGATDGIGYLYAKELAKRGLNVVLISRSMDKLKQRQQEIIADHQVKVKVIQVDFSQPDVYDKIRSDLAELDVGVLVNNVGMTQRHASKYLDIPNGMAAIPDMLNTNCLSMSLMSMIVLPGMLEKGRGVVVNVSSIVPEPCQGGMTISAPYSATKAYMSMLSHLLKRSYASKDLHIQTLKPSLLSTNMAGCFQAESPSAISQLALRLIAVTPNDFVKSAINTIGWTDECHGHLKSYLMSFALAMSPQFYQDWTLTL